MQPSQVFASMTNNNGAANLHDPNDKYAVFKNMNATAGSPSVFNAGQPQGKSYPLCFAYVEINT